jgi:hypothetical protein
MTASTNRKSGKNTNHCLIESEIFLGPPLKTEIPFDLDFEIIRLKQNTTKKKKKKRKWERGFDLSATT